MLIVSSRLGLLLAAMSSFALMVLAIEPCASAHAQAFPNRPVRLLVGFPPGGGADITARNVAAKLNAIWGQPVVVENRPGAGSNVASNIAAKAAADGYTLLLCQTASHAINPALYRTLPYDHVRDFAPVSLIGTTANVLVVNTSVPAKSVGEFIAYAKANPDKILYGSAGVGSMLHLAMELFRSATGLDIVHVPYKGGAPAEADLLGGHVAAMFDTLPAYLTLVGSGRVRALGISSARRDPRVPDLPTISESAVPGFEVMLWFGICAPAAVPKPVLAKLNADVVMALNTLDLRQRLAEQGIDAAPSTPEQFVAHIRSETLKWARAVKDSGASAD